jgi:hypothetical protein
VCIGMINAYFINYEGKRPARRRSRRLEYNIIVDFTESGFGGMDSIHLAHDMEQCRCFMNRASKLRVI